MVRAGRPSFYGCLVEQPVLHHTITDRGEPRGRRVVHRFPTSIFNLLVGAEEHIRVSCKRTGSHSHAAPTHGAVDGSSWTGKNPDSNSPQSHAHSRVRHFSVVHCRVRAPG